MKYNSFYKIRFYSSASTTFLTNCVQNCKASWAVCRSLPLQSKHQEVCSAKRFRSSSTGSTRLPFEGVGNVDGQREEEDFGIFVKEMCSIPGMGHRALVIQPDIKGGRRKYVMTTKHLKLEETCALVRTLPNWRVVEKKIVRTDFEQTNEVFGSGNFDKLLAEIRGKRNVSAVVIGIDRLRSIQIHTLQKAWGLPVFDRYTIILQIFKDHAMSEEAKLQVALAEIPYIKFRFDLIHQGQVNSGVHIFGSKSMSKDRRNELLRTREANLKKELNKLHKKRQDERDKRKINNEPTVAVVGYTNAGKTTLIKALTDDQSIVPKNQLFATLDVTSHQGLLPSKMKVTYVDTVGFISDMPDSLLEAFRATLEDALMADVILHVRDASHPDLPMQVMSVHKTLQSLLPENKLAGMVEIYNKTDLVTEEQLEDIDTSFCCISATTGQGFQELGQRLQKAIMAVSGQMEKTFRIPNSENILGWLQVEAAVRHIEPDPKDSQYLLVKVIISQRAYGMFKARFVRKK